MARKGLQRLESESKSEGAGEVCSGHLPHGFGLGLGLGLVALAPVQPESHNLEARAAVGPVSLPEVIR